MDVSIFSGHPQNGKGFLFGFPRTATPTWPPSLKKKTLDVSNCGMATLFLPAI